MTFLRNLGLQQKLAIFVGTGLLLVVIVGLFSLWQLQALYRSSAAVSQVWLPRIEMLGSIRGAMNQHRLLSHHLRQAPGADELGDAASRIAALDKQIDRLMTAYEAQIGTATEKSLFAEVEDRWHRYRAVVGKFQALPDAAITPVVRRQFENETLTLAAWAIARVDTLVEYSEKQSNAAVEAAQSTFRSSLVLTLSAIVLSAIFGSLAIFWVRRNISLPILRVIGAMRRLNAGDASVSVPAEGGRRDEVGALIEAANGYRESLLRSRKLAEAGEQDRQRFLAAINNMPIGLVMFDAEQKLITANARYAEIYRLPRHLATPGTPLAAILDNRVQAGRFPGGDAQKYKDYLAGIVSQGSPFRDIIQFRDGRIISLVYQPMEGGGWVSTHEDVTDRRKAEAKIAHMTHHDGLTDLPNRILLRERIEDALVRVGRGGHVAVLNLDLDHFKDVNDTLGHSVGDALLTAVARRLAAAVRDGDTVARLGGDEFAIVQVGGEQPHAARTLAQRVIDALGEPYLLESHEVITSVSIGIALAPADGGDAHHLLKAADMALYRAKGDGRGVYRFFERAMDARMQSRRALEADIRAGIEGGQFELFYQPQFNLATNAVSGFEALLRWFHPERGFLSPLEFIPLAEESGLIVPIGEWVLKQACRDAAKMPAPVKVAVNLSPAQFRSAHLLQTVIAALAGSGLPAGRLELEITESVLLADNEATLTTLHHLRAMGVRISMDDFGTGYSSLSYLQSFPFDKIKIDKRFITDLNTDGSSLAIIRAVAGLGASLGITTTAEGVETREQFDRVKAEGCTEVQGFLTGRPVPLRDALALMQRPGSKASAA